ncbi:hypothetical protein BD769DRAFT_1637946 [Suillus cothurnatus]|nr:hypothetical protein BD769DRAFT_1637946 [Suillus cothurnatus]
MAKKNSPMHAMGAFIVTDGVTIGGPCCAIPRCKNPLTTNHRRYCLEHQNLEGVCAVEGCGWAVTSDPKTGKLQKACNDPIHVKMEAANMKSSCSGKSRTQRNKIVKLNDAMESSMHDLIDEVKSIPLQDTDEWYEHEIATGAVCLVQASVTTSTGVSDLAPNEPYNHDNSVPACSGKDAPVKLKAVFHRQCMNNERLIVRPCGIISGRGTMYHHQAVSNVLFAVYDFSSFVVDNALFVGGYLLYSPVVLFYYVCFFEFYNTSLALSGKTDNVEQKIVKYNPTKESAGTDKWLDLILLVL